MKKLFFITTLLVSFFVFSSNQAQAQANFKTGIGLRLGYSYGLTVKHFLNDKWAIEGILGSRFYGHGYRGFGGGTLAILGEYHGQISGVAGLSWFAGFGGHIGSWYGGGYGNKHWSEDRYYFSIGLDGILGLEYTIPSAPFSFGLDWKPEFDFLGGFYFYGTGLALSVRYAIK